MTQHENTSVAPEKQNAPEENKNELITMGAVAFGLIALGFWKPDLAKGILAFVVTLGVLVLVHEWGHFQFGRWAGMKINRFALGFPPWIFTKYRKGIAYSIGALPIGGMVDIAGLGSEEEMVSDAHGADVTAKYRKRENVPHGQKEFQEASWGWRFMTLFAGPLMNFIFAMIVFSLVFSLVGIPFPKDVTRRVDYVEPGMPAFNARIQGGDIIEGINGIRSESSQEIIDMVKASNGKPVQVLVNRGGVNRTVTMTPQVGDGMNELTGEREKQVRIGIAFVSVNENVRVGVWRGETGFWDGAIGSGLRLSADMTQRIFGLLQRVVTLNMTDEDKRSVGGPVKIAQAIDHTANKSWQELVLTAAALSVNLGLMNLLPIPALDGGRIMFLGYELIARRRANPRIETFINAAGMVMVLFFMAFMTLRDIFPFLMRKFAS